MIAGLIVYGVFGKLMQRFDQERSVIFWEKKRLRLLQRQLKFLRKRAGGRARMSCAQHPALHVT
jgi:hypothetical protein